MTSDSPSSLPAVPPPVPLTGLPPGNAEFPVQTLDQFVGRFNTGSNSFYPLFDEALQQSRENAYRMRLDPVLGPSISIRVYPTSLLTAHLAAADPEDPRQVEAAGDMEKRLCNIPGMLWCHRWLLWEGEFVGHAGVMLRRRWEYHNDRRYLLPDSFKPVSGDSLEFGYWHDEIGIRVNSLFDPGVSKRDRIRPGPLGRAYFLDSEERESIIVHRFEPEAADFFKPWSAGQINGLGFRGRLYWLWVLKSMVWGMGMDFLKWFARGLWVYYFRSGDPNHQKEVMDWVNHQFGNPAMFFPRRDDGGPAFEPLQRFDPSTASPQFLQSLVADYFDNVMRIAILHQTLTSTVANTGLGSGVAAAHMGTFESIVKYDATALQDTYTTDLVRPAYRAAYPGVTPARWVFEIDDPNIQQLIENAETIYQMGGAVVEKPLLEAAGLPDPKQGDTILSNVQPMQPAATDQLPTGVPEETAVNAQTGPVQMDRARLLATARRAWKEGWFTRLERAVRNGRVRMSPGRKSRPDRSS